MYQILKFYSDDTPTRRIKKVHSLETAQAICRDPKTSSRHEGAPIYRKQADGSRVRVDWFYGYQEA